MGKTKDLLGLKDKTAQEITAMLDRAAQMKQLIIKREQSGLLRGKNIYLLFYEPSTRTCTSFQAAAQNLGANCVNVAVNNSSISKGETFLDTGATIDRLGADIIVIRHRIGGAPRFLARNIRAGVINAGDGTNEHPTQALLDMFTLREKLGKIEGLNIAIVGDIKYSRVARSNIWGLTKMGAKVRLCAPATLMPADAGKLPVTIYSDLKAAVKDVDAVIALRLQLERQTAGLFPGIKEYHRYYGITSAVMKNAKPGALLMHPGPVNRGAELSSEVCDGAQSVIREQVTNGVAVRMAIMADLCGK